MSIQRREVYLVMKQLSDGRVMYVEGLKEASGYFFDGHVRVGLSSNTSSSFVDFDPNERPMQLFHMPDEHNGKWQAAYHDFGCNPPVGKAELEFVVFVGAYSNDRDRTIELMRMGMVRAWEIVDGKRQLRNGEFFD
ncbi:hypothetical protein ACSI5N_25570 (plasmid) [Raoultella ornithinolytica]|uniref:hypothetical protein n=1 Tax=Raoultella ornithinolytica TaxID=54291 RepID=UPI00292B4AB6|nr:hypothetical protein [Raoultella ornithinolytica]MDV1094996.1 hypothetical protein [Raoultella ornithinolytica]MDV1122660.1 hypothetical protein [Raoultella ornithinolytica]MDV1893175.1 hypothetical protein [Raoultella ornithinolytica]